MGAPPEPGLPDASLIVCSRGRPLMLRETVEGILAGDELPAELIIVDQSDEPDPAFRPRRTVDGCSVRYRWVETVGLSRASNAGVAMAQHDLLVFTHDDVRVTPTWFGTIVRSLLEAGTRTVVTGRVLPEEVGAGAHGFVPSTKVSRERRVYEAPTGEGVLYPMAMAMHRSVLLAVGSFDERLGPGTPYPAAEDNDLSYRLLRAGYRILYDPDPVLHHRAWRPESDFYGLRWSYGRGQGAFYAKHLGMKDWLTLRHLAAEIRYRVVKALRLLLPKPRTAWGEAVYLAGLASGLGAWVLARGRGRSERRDVEGGAP